MSATQSFDAATLPLSGLRLIEASAGTGKTFSLAGLVLRLIVEQDATVRDILVMTFTRAATAELRERIRKRLTEAVRIDYAPGQAAPDNAEHAFTQQILAASGQDRAALAHRLADAAARVDEATIVTIHGFAQRAAAENAFDSALAFDRGTPVDDPSIHREVVADYWRSHVFGAPGAGGDVLALWQSPDALYRTIAPMLNRPHVELAGINRERMEQLLKALKKQWPGTAEPLAAALNAARANNALYKNSMLNVMLAEHDDASEAITQLDRQITTAVAAGRIPALPQWVTAFADPETQFKQSPKRCQAFAEPLADLPALPVLAELRPLARLVAIEQAVTAVREAAAARKIERRQYSFNDLIAALHDALIAPATGERLAEALHARWPYALVDEFQDTDPLQYASLHRIYLARQRERGALLLIGDPKQAIYGFRGGDIYAYLAAARAAGTARYTLATNFRSTPGLLAAIEALHRLPADHPFIADIDFPHVEAGRAAGDRRLVTAEGADFPALTFWHLHHGSGTKKEDRPLLIGHTVAAIGQLLDGRSAHWAAADGTATPLAPRDIAILVNNNQEASTLQAELARHGIMAVCQHRDSVFASPEADDLRRILRAMAAPDNAMAVRAAQPTALIGKRLAELIALADDDHTLQIAIERFHTLHEIWAARGVLAALGELLMTAAPDLLALTGGERRMSNYLQLSELLAAAEAQCFGMTSVAHWLDDRLAAARAGEVTDDSQLKLESDADLVRITTVHGAKGLQYPIVFLPFALWLGTAGTADKPPLLFHDDGGQALIDVLGDEPEHVDQAVLEARSEALRLLYVALTRAEQAVIVGWREAKTSQNGALSDLLARDGGAASDALAALTNQHPGTIVVTALDAEQPAPGIERYQPPSVEHLSEARCDLPVARPYWTTYSFSRLARAAESQAAVLPEPGAEDELASAPAETIAADTGVLPKLDDRLAGMRFGSAVHAVLESVRAVDWPAPGGALNAGQRGRIAATLRRYGLLDDDDADPRVEQTADLIARTLHTPLPGIGPLAALDPARTRAEMAFMLRLRGGRLSALISTLRAAGYLPTTLGGNPTQRLHGLMEGFIDLLAEVDGRYFILDYKTNRLGDTPAAYRGPVLARAIGRSHYDLQYLIYTVALHRHLGHCLGSNYDPAAHLGGVCYLFVRAMDGQTTTGVFTDRPDIALIEALDTLFDSARQIT
jgi:exodeoxyribonuclease V beta subunit